MCSQGSHGWKPDYRLPILKPDPQLLCHPGDQKTPHRNSIVYVKKKKKHGKKKTNVPFGEGRSWLHQNQNLAVIGVRQWQVGPMMSMRRYVPTGLMARSSLFIEVACTCSFQVYVLHLCMELPPTHQHQLRVDAGYASKRKQEISETKMQAETPT